MESAASSWQHRVGGIELAASSWQHRVGSIDLAASSWQHRVGSIELGHFLFDSKRLRCGSSVCLVVSKLGLRFYVEYNQKLKKWYLHMCIALSRRVMWSTTIIYSISINTLVQNNYNNQKSVEKCVFRYFYLELDACEV